MVGLDAFEWNPPHSDRKYKILAFMDFATHFKVIHVVREYGINQQQTESAQEVLDGLYQC